MDNNLLKIDPALQILITNKTHKFQKQIQVKLQNLHERIEHDDEIIEYKKRGFTYFSKIVLKEIHYELMSAMSKETAVDTQTLATICMALRLNELEILQWYLYTYLLVNADTIITQRQALKFERCDEMMIATAILSKVINVSTNNNIVTSQ